VADFYERCQLLVHETLRATEDLLEAHGFGASGSSASAQAGEQHLEGLYVTGGGSELPIVARVLREAFGRRVRRSAYTRSATAIGLAIQADSQAGYVLRDQFTRHFGVWREADAAEPWFFDSLFSKGTQLPAPEEPPLTQSRQYTPVHNIGHFRYLECSHLTDEGRPPETSPSGMTFASRLILRCAATWILEGCLSPALTRVFIHRRRKAIRVTRAVR